MAVVSEARVRCDSTVEPVSLEGRVEERVLSGLGDEKELLSLRWGTPSDWELRTEPERACGGGGGGCAGWGW